MVFKVSKEYNEMKYLTKQGCHSTISRSIFKFVQLKVKIGTQKVSLGNGENRMRSLFLLIHCHIFKLVAVLISELFAQNRRYLV